MGDAAHSLKMSACHKDWTQDVIRPSTWDVAREFWNWGGANAMDTDVIRFVRIPAIVRGKDAPAGCARIDITPRLAMDNRRAFGYLAKIFDSSATQNTDTPYRMTAIIQIAYFDQHGDPPSWFWAKTNLFFAKFRVNGTAGGSPGEAGHGDTRGHLWRSSHHSWKPGVFLEGGMERPRPGTSSTP